MLGPQPPATGQRSLVPGAVPTFASDKKTCLELGPPATWCLHPPGHRLEAGSLSAVIKGHRVSGQASFHSLVGFPCELFRALLASPLGGAQVLRLDSHHVELFLEDEDAPRTQKNLVGVAPSGFGVPATPQLSQGGAWRWMWAGASAGPGRGLGPGQGCWAGPGAWRKRWVGSWVAPGRNQCISCLPRDGRVDWLRDFSGGEQIPGLRKAAGDWPWVTRLGLRGGLGRVTRAPRSQVSCCACCSPLISWSPWPLKKLDARLPDGATCRPLRGGASASSRWCPLVRAPAVTDVGMWADGRRWAATLGREEESCAEGVGAMQGQGLCLTAGARWFLACLTLDFFFSRNENKFHSCLSCYYFGFCHSQSH